ncbi:hypothetical protein [Acanthopleuribacter pedis]|uniref:Alanine dehydrogenase/pyridine nucleotide transhydrogenase N-terminal domain-containing protein n=1 Tax=Acanthopleuribacter pedis TaxID=442870 RepID=A0A8J7QM17_9BACT|nr:hypothetical protein [Acanthopleuribacter pedis]MBO1322115.1 hypothetical protein [Acanthopleuribacter pedis]
MDKNQESRKPLTAYVRAEHKSPWEGRTPLTPDATQALVDRDIPVVVERSEFRCHKDNAFARAGATLSEDLHGAQLVLGIKEPALDSIEPGQVHVAFSHTIKGQAYNMPLLQRFIDQKATIIDYETMRDAQGVRTIAFGRFAGIAGAVDTFHILGRKLVKKGIVSSLSQIDPTYRYDTIARLRTQLSGLEDFTAYPVRVVINGTGNVSRGCQEVCRWMGLKEIQPEQIVDGKGPEGSWFCVLGSKDIVKRRDGGAFDAADYRHHGKDAYENDFHKYLGSFNVLLQTIYWDETYPKQMDHEAFLTFRDALPTVIGDISCDIDGSLACTKKASTIDEPAFSYNPEDGTIEDGIHWDRLSVMSIDHLPCQLSLDASDHFANILVDYVVEMASMDLTKPLEECGLGRLLREATIVYRGELTEPYSYLQSFLDAAAKEVG